VRALWHRQLAVPLANGEAAAAAYEAWEATTGKVGVWGAPGHEAGPPTN
jgi:hypothetical protein